MTVSTTSAAVHITPVVLKTFLEHYKRKTKKLREGHSGQEVATDDILFDEAFHIVQAFIQLGTQNTIESLQAFTNTHIPAPFWTAVVPVMVSLSSCNRAADLLIDWFGPEELKRVVGGERWWQVRGMDGIASEWITEGRFLDDAEVAGDGEKLSDDEETIKKMEKLETVMLYVHGGAYFWGSINTHRYQIIRFDFYLISPPPGAAHKPVSPSKITFAGDSAGGALCITALTVLRDMGIPLPAGAVLISPWVDLTHSFPSVMSNTHSDIIPPHGFVHKPSTTWPVEPIANGSNRIRVTDTKTNPPPGPGHADTLSPTPHRMCAEHNAMRSAKEEGKGVQEMREEEQDRHDGVQSQNEMLKHMSISESQNEVGEERESGIRRNEELDASDGAAVRNESSGDPSLWEPKPPKVLMKDPDTIPLEIRSQIQQYATNEQLTHPLVSPILQGSLGNLCPLYIIAGDGEVLRDEIIYFAHRAAHPDEYPVRQGVLMEGRRQKENVKKFTMPTKVHLQVYDGMPHVLTVFIFTDCARYAYQSIAKFIKHVTCHSSEHLARNPFPELHRPQPDAQADGYASDDTSSSEDERQRRGRKATRSRWVSARHKVAGEKEISQHEAKLFKENEEVVTQEVKRNEADKLPGFSGILEDSFSMEGSEDIPHVLMIRERVDLLGHVRPMEPKDEVSALQLRPSEVGVIKEDPVRRWLAGQEKIDRKFKRSAERVVKKRKKLEAKAEKMLADARDKGLVLHDDGGRIQGDVQRADRGASNPSISSVDSERVIDKDRRWGPLDLEGERPPPSAIAKRRDTPEALALLKKSIYHTAPVTHMTVPKMKRMQLVRATFDPNDHPVRAPRQSVSEQQTFHEKEREEGNERKAASCGRN
ncbi:Esterase/Lipase [Heterobasidion irregulare TC 32-1]|uniref:Esterase/Lipase n=1 Tax=Heterobasidion irregulare (strain TC 32-1) TaxID=747525 RepID=W4KD11_HETIT|nr:Esterase/Lipase [Heterobasidion irregulare TC 32-1]ETW83742.1 Esterase/Lipase [Heterobasidion irregulare TC 32-1]